MKTHSLLLGSLILGLAPALANANTYYVKPAAEGGSDSNNGTSWDTAFATPAKGFSTVNGKNRNDEVLIAPGTYELADAIGCNGGNDGSTHVFVHGTTDNPEDVVLRSPGDREVLRLAKNITVANMTLENGTNNKRYTASGAAGVRVGGVSNLGTLSVVSNCIVRGCHNEYGNGNYGSPVVVRDDGLLVDCVVSNNTAIWRGCGVMLAGPNAKALRCVITGNDATSSDNCGASVLGCTIGVDGWGGGILEGCTISNNTGSIYAGAVNVAKNSGCLFESNLSSKTLDGSRGALCVNMIDAEISGCTFRGNTARTGGGVDVANYAASFTDCIFENNAVQDCGGGVRVAGTANVSLENCQFVGNSTTAGIGDNNGGGGLFIASQTASGGWCSVSNCIFVGNSTGARGGALGFTWNGWAHGAIGNCIFTNNTSSLQGGGLCVREGQSNTHTDNLLTIRNSLIAFNRTTTSNGDSNGGGICFVTPNQVSMENCTIVSNITAYSVSGGVHHRWGGQLVNCIIAFNKRSGGANDEVASGTVWSCAEGTYLNCCSYPNMPSHLTAGNGCINADPLFTDAANGDFTLGNNSPCANKGRLLDWMTKDAFDLSGLVPRVSSSYPDIGCYECPIPHFILLFR